MVSVKKASDPPNSSDSDLITYFQQELEPENSAGVSEAVHSYTALKQVSATDFSNLLDVSRQTLYRWAREGRKLPGPYSYVLRRMFDVLRYGREVVFDGKEEWFTEWLNARSIPLNGKKPIEVLLESPFGIDAVYDELVRIEHSDY